MSTAVVAAMLGGLSPQAAAAAPAAGPPARQGSFTQALSALDRAAASLPKTDSTPAAAPPSKLERMSRDWDREMVETYAEFDEFEEVREAAKKALESSDPNAIREFLEHGMAEARKRAQEKKDDTDAGNRKKIEAMRGTGGPHFNAEVERVLGPKATARDRADFLAFGAKIARERDEKDQQTAKDRAAELRKRVQMLAGVGGPEVQKAAQAALDAGSDKAIEEFLEKGYQIAAQKDAEDRAAHEKALKEAQEAAEKLRDLAQRTARAAEARTKLIAVHGDAVRELKTASNAMTQAAAAAREADRMLSADRAGKRLSDYGNVKAEVARQVKDAIEAARAAKVAALQAKVQADILVETGLTHGTQWAEVAYGIEAAADAAAKAAETAQHAVDATAADAAALNSKNAAQAHEQQARKWRANAEEQAKAAAQMAAAAEKQAKIAADAAARSKQARIDAEKAEQEAWEHAKKTHQARLEAQRQAKIAAEQRAIAERERNLAAQARARAERERDKAAAARARAEAEARTAAAARAEAQSAAATAASARAGAAEKEGIAARADEKARGEETNARNARNAAFKAEQNHQAKEARAKAIEAAAASGRGTAAAGEANTAAQAARADANAAGAAAGQARSAADTASGAAVRARSAATEAAGAAARARAAAAEATAHAARANAAANKAEAAAASANAAANKAEAEYQATHAAALKANTKAAEATAQEARAGIAAHEASRLAGLAAQHANNALQAANRTKEEAEGATREAAMARLQSTIAVQASGAARNTAAGIADPANTAIELTAPFAGKDVDADFAAEVAKAAQETGEEQVASAEAKAAEAVKAAEAAEAAAKRAGDQVAPAFKAAADAARSSANAARSAAAAMKSAAEAAADGAKARAAAASANKADAQAKGDADLARQAANQAAADAAAARKAANEAEAEAARARKAAAEADQHAAAANSAANQAEHEASVAQGAAAQAEKDAADAGKLADSAESHAKSAETAAKNANQYAKEADEAAKKAEEYEREQERKRRAEAVEQAGKGGGSELSWQDEVGLEDAGISPEEYEKLQKDAEKSIGDFLSENGGEILKGLLGLDDIEKCFTEGNVESCIWTLVGALPWGKAVQIIKKFPEVSKAVYRVVTGFSEFIEETDKAKKLIGKSKEALEKFRQALSACTRKNSFTPETPVLMADGTRKPIKDIQIGQRVLATDPDTGTTGAWAVTDTIVGEGQKHLVEITIDSDGKAGDSTGTVNATEGHPFWVDNQGRWLDAKDLKAGDRLRTSRGDLREVVNTRAWTAVSKVYNLTVEGPHTYYVWAGAAAVLVHNSNNVCGVKALEDGDWQHIVDRHRPGGVNVDPKAGLLIGKEKIVRKRIAEAINRGRARPNTPDPETGRPRPGQMYEWDFGVPVGKAGPANGSGELTSIRVIVNDGKVVTAFPV
ncbi:polymorphic toxin-type HINT domain-containing protein [Streptomyces sp. cg2]|uniref:polymorphic toxin-type HINT domain-containing protein n=1 Tax=Streptomyces sp. cg2 TaxID=3238799 RepID=UPI0034E1C12F